MQKNSLYLERLWPLYLFVLSVTVHYSAPRCLWAQNTSQEQNASPVVIEKVMKKSIRPMVTMIGTTIPNRTSVVAAEIDGLVVSFPVRNGQRVKKGDVLVKIETRPLLLQLKAAESSLAETKENYANALAELKRSEALFEQKSISSKEYDKTLYAANAIRERILGLEAEMELIKYRLARSVIRASFDGFVVEEHTQVGQWLKEGAEAVTIAEIDPILVLVPVPDRYIHYLKVKQEVDLEFDFLPDNNRRKGYVRYVIPKGNESARTFPVHISVENRNLSLLAGMSCKVTVPAGTPYEALLVNKDAVITKEQGDHLFAVRDGKAEIVEVKLGQAYENQVVVEGDLSAGEKVVVEGNERLRPGEPVREINEEGR